MSRSGPVGPTTNSPKSIRGETSWRVVVGTVLRIRRIELRLTLQQLADRTHISMGYLSEIERGNKDISSDLLAAWVRALDLDLYGLLRMAALRVGPGVETRRTGD